MAYGIMGGSRNSHMLTYQTTRAVKCIYFDGESATLFGTGQLDTQMLHIWGNLSGPARPDTRYGGLWEEYARAIGLCDWLSEKGLGGPGWGFEGIVRMNAGFEMIWCNFSSPSLRLISHLNVTAPLLPERGGEVTTKGSARQPEGPVTKHGDYEPTSYFPLPPSPTRSDKATDPSNPAQPPMRGRDDWVREPFIPTQAWNWFLSSTAHYGSSGDGPGLGESRVKITTCGFLSYYSPVFQSQAIPRANEERKALNLTDEGYWIGEGKHGVRSDALNSLTRRRRLHTLEDITPSDAAIMRANSERILKDLLSDSATNCSGIDWIIVASDIVQSYASPLLKFVSTLEKFDNVTKGNRTALRDWMEDVRDQTHTFLVPFLQYPDEEDDKSLWTRDSTLFKDTYARCRFQHTRLLDPQESIPLGPEETLLKWSVEEITGDICSVLVDVGLAVEGIWESKFNIPLNSTSEIILVRSIKTEVTRWTEGVQELMAWLGWASEWVRCEEKCTWDETCYIPMWPLIQMGGGGGRGPGRRPYRPPGSYRPGYGGPGYGRPPDGFPGNQTGRRPGRGFNPWGPSEDDLWKPRCVKSDEWRLRLKEDMDRGGIPKMFT
jgi:hypothetical protein